MRKTVFRISEKSTFIFKCIIEIFKIIIDIFEVMF